MPLTLSLRALPHGYEVRNYGGRPIIHVLLELRVRENKKSPFTSRQGSITRRRHSMQGLSLTCMHLLPTLPGNWTNGLIGLYQNHYSSPAYDLHMRADLKHRNWIPGPPYKTVADLLSIPTEPCLTALRPHTSLIRMRDRAALRADFFLWRKSMASQGITVKVATRLLMCLKAK